VRSAQAETGEVVVKKTLRTMMLVSAGVLGSVAVAQAQQPAPPAAPPAPPPAPPAAPPAQPPPAEFGVAPAALPAAPAASAPVPAVNFGTQPAGDTTTPAPAAPEKKSNPFFFTRLTWGNTGSTQMFGIGKDYQGSEGQRFDMDFSLNLRYYAVNEPLDKLYFNAGLGLTTELTNSDVTSKKHTPYFKDLPLGVGYSHTVYRNADKTVVTSPSVSLSYSIPTSEASRAQGKFGSLSANLGLAQILPLAGPKSDWFSDIFIIGVAGWSHLFSKATTPVNDNVSIIRPRQGLDPLLPASQDQLSSGWLTHDNARLSLTYYLTIYKDLSLGNTWEVSMPFKYSGSSGQCVTIATGCVPVGASDPGSRNYTTTFDLGLSYVLFNTARIDLGYQNVSAALDDNKGLRRSIFYGPDSAFYGNVALYIDTILDKTLGLTEQKKTAANGRFTRGAY
jgi:hypothetical protein